MTEERKAALANVRRQTRRLAEAERAFADAIFHAADAAPQRAIAEAAGLSVGRVNQIIHGNG